MAVAAKELPAGGNDPDFDQRQVEGADPPGSDAGNKAVWRAKKVDWHRQSEGADGPAPGDGAERPFGSYCLSGGSAPCGVHFDRAGIQPETDSGCYVELGRGV